MSKIPTTVFLLISACLTNLASGQNPGVVDPLPEFLSRLSSATQSPFAFKLSGSGGPQGDYSKLFRSNEKFGVLAIEGEKEFRSIWNPKYRAEIEKVAPEKWMLRTVSLHNDNEGYEDFLRNENVTGCFFGGLVKRLEVLELVGVTQEADGSLYEYRYTPDCPVYSLDPLLNSFLIKFNENSKNIRIQEIRHWESGGDIKVSSTTRFEYPEDYFFPLKRIGKASVVGGGMTGTKIETEDRVEIDTDAKFVSSECYLSHYGLPEPNIPSDFAWLNRPITWIVVGSVLVLCFILLVSRYRRGR